MPSDSRLNDCHDYSQNWVMVARPLGIWNGYAPLHVKFFDDLSLSTLMWNTSTQLKRHPCQWCKGGFIPSTHPQGTTRNHDWTELTRCRHEGMPEQKWGVASRVYPFPTHQTEIDRYCGFKIFNFSVFLSLFLCINIIITLFCVCVLHEEWTQVAI